MLSLILPTFNEAQNLPSLVDLIDGTLRDTPHEIIVVDDNSPDGTWKVAEMLSEIHPSLRILRRIGKKGLSSAVMEGFDAARGDMLLVMDADGQHDAALLLRLLAALDAGAEVAIGSRYIEGGSVGEWVRDRRILSRAGTHISNRLARVRVSDPLSGFFAMRSALYKRIRSSLRPQGFKILLEVLAHVPEGTRVAEVPLVFRMRLHGESKLSLGVHLAFASQVLRLALGRVGGFAQSSGSAIFFALVIMLAVALFPRAWALRGLSDTTHRARSKSALEETARREGWLLSDITLTGATDESLSIFYQPHLRSSVPGKRCTLQFEPILLTCEAD